MAGAAGGSADARRAGRPDLGHGDLAALDLRPLTARSVILSTLLGSHPPRLPVRSLVRVGSLFGIAEGTVRVALSRMTAEGDLVQSDATYQLTARLLARQRRQDESREPSARPWSGGWEVVLLPDGIAGPDRESLVATLRDLHLAEYARAVWMRPDNLQRDGPLPAEGGAVLLASPVADGAVLAHRLWDLGGWAQRAEALERAMEAVADPALRFTVSAAVLRHLRDDPVLPAPLLPPGWPGARLRRQYLRFEQELRILLRAPAPA